MCTGTGAFGSELTPWQWRSKEDIRAMPPKDQSPGTNTYSPPPNRSLGLDGPLAEVDFFIRFQGPAGRIGAPQEQSGLYRTNPGPARWTRKTNQGPEKQIRARRTNQGPARQIRVRKTNQGPAG